MNAEQYKQQRDEIAADLSSKFAAEIDRIQKIKVDHFTTRVAAGLNDDSDNLILDKAWKELRRTADSLQFYADLVKRNPRNPSPAESGT